MARGQPEGEQGYTPEVSAEDLPRKMVPEIRSVPLAGAVEQFGNDVANTLNRKYMADSASYASDALAKFRTDQFAKIEQMKNAVPPGTDPGTLTEQWSSSYNKDSTDLINAASRNPIASKILSKGVDEFGETMRQHVLGWGYAQQKAYQVDSIQENLKSQLPVVEAHPEAAGQIGSTLSDQINTLALEPASRLQLMRTVHEQLSLAAANGMARQDPRGVLEGLNNPEKAPDTLRSLTEPQIEQVRDRANRHLADPVFAALSQGDVRGAQRMLNANADVMDSHTFESVQRGILATDEHNLVMQEKYQKVASDALAKQGDELLSQGKLSADWISRNSKTLEANEVRYFYRALSGNEESSTNSQVFADLYLRGTGGEDIRDLARQHLTEQHDLSRQDFTKIVSLYDSQVGGDYKRGVQYITETLKPSELEKDPAGHQSLAYALRDYADWHQQHPDAKLKESQEAADTIANHYRIVPEGQTALMTRAPLYLVGSRTMPVDENGNPDPQLNATVRRYQQAVKSGEISGDAAQAEAIRINQLRAVIARQLQRQAQLQKTKTQ